MELPALDAGIVTRAVSLQILNLRLQSTKEGVGETSGETV